MTTHHLDMTKTQVQQLIDGETVTALFTYERGTLDLDGSKVEGALSMVLDGHPEQVSYEGDDIEIHLITDEELAESVS